MPISGTLYPWDKINVQLVREEPATFALYHNEQIIFIGSTPNLRETFNYFYKTKFKDDPRKIITNNYRREYRSDYKEREIELLKEFQHDHNRLPKCYDYIPDS